MLVKDGEQQEEARGLPPPHAVVQDITDEMRNNDKSLIDLIRDVSNTVFACE